MNVAPSKGKAQLFQSPLLERLTNTNIIFPLTIFPLIAIGTIYYCVSNKYLGPLETGFVFILGIVLFTLVEYLMHRYLYHLRSNNKYALDITYKMHGVHHDHPKDEHRLAMPIPLSLVISSVFFLLFKVLLGNYVFAFFPGFIIGYTAYLGIHYSVHAFAPPKNFLKILWIHHARHHYKNSEHAFGVSSPLWDIIFGTMPKA
jgi:sterol desaturase/sphingolipid hydroxylase (fatty acid hydroxylase superfamily)